MDNAEFRVWLDRQQYEHWTHSHHDLCTPYSSIYNFTKSRPIPEDVSRICQMIDVLDRVASAECDAEEVILARGLLVKWSGPRNLPEGRWVAQRLNRLCCLAAAVQALAMSERAELAGQRDAAVELIEGWGR